MKCFIAILLLALFAVAFAQANPIEPEKLEPGKLEPVDPAQDGPRDKRGALITYSYTPYLPYGYRTFPYYNYYL